MNERVKQLVELINGMDDEEIEIAIQMMTTSCVQCDIRQKCEFAYAPYNVDVEPKIDCLAAK